MTVNSDEIERGDSVYSAIRRPPPPHAIFFDGALKPQAGGPSGYLWNLRKGIAECGKSDCVQFIIRDQDPDSDLSSEAAPKISAVRLGLERLAQKLPYAKSIQRSFIGGKFYRDWRGILEIAENPSCARFGSDVAGKINCESIATIHAHETIQAILLHNELVASGLRSRVKLMLTSHCPELPGAERAAACRDAGLFKPFSNRLRQAHIRADEYAFALADVVIFPSLESMEPYTAGSASIAATLKKKDVRFVLTGVRSKEAAGYPVPEALRACSDKFVVSFVGRHNSIKGYDTLKDAAKILFEKYKDMAVVVAGHPGPLEPLDHPRWIELGWTPNPEYVIAASDVFVLPNRSTFFDLVLLEAMSIGKPVIASRTGGNVTVAGLSNGISLFDGLDGLVTRIEEMRALSRVERSVLAQTNQKAYQEQFSIKRFAANYLSAVSDGATTI